MTPFPLHGTVLTLPQQVLPVPDSPPQHASIRITDMFPATTDHRHWVWPIDLDVYRQLLAKGIKELATVRAIETLRPRTSKDAVDQEYEVAM